jgi:hypothetical protein
MKRRHFERNTSFHLKENGATKLLFPNQSLIFNLFNQALNWDFDFKNQFNYNPAKFKN